MGAGKTNISAIAYVIRRLYNAAGGVYNTLTFAILTNVSSCFITLINVIERQVTLDNAVYSWLTLSNARYFKVYVKLARYLR